MQWSRCRVSTERKFFSDFLFSFPFLKARDCLYLGKNAFSNGYYGHSLEWFEEALNRAHREGNQTADVDEIMPFYEMAVEYVSYLSSTSIF